MTVYRIVWRDMARYMVWPCGHDMVYGMAWRGLALYRKCPAGHGLVRYGMVYDTAWRAWHGMAWRGMAWYIV